MRTPIPIGIWREWATDVRGQAVAAGHFFPEEIPDETAAALRAFFAGGRRTPSAAARLPQTE
jgi:haloacetate dehalogenase